MQYPLVLIQEISNPYGRLSPVTVFLEDSLQSNRNGNQFILELDDLEQFKFPIGDELVYIKVRTMPDDFGFFACIAHCNFQD